MRIAIDAVGINKYGGGRTATLQLLQSIFKIDEENKYLVALSAFEPTLDMNNDRVRQWIIPIQNRFLARIFMQIIFPIKFRNYDLIHFTKNLNLLGIKPPQVVTIFDMTHVLHPELIPKIDHWYYSGIQKKMLKSVSRIIAISHDAAQGIKEIYHVPEEKIRVIHLAAGAHFKPAPEDIISIIKRNYNLPDKYFIHVGHLDRKKNLTNMVKAFRMVKDKVKFTGALVLVGPEYPKGHDYELMPTIMELHLEQDVILTGAAPDTDLPALLSGAIAKLFPSTHEGFGLAPLEAMACATPVIASSAGAVAEVIGDAGILLPDTKPETIAQAMIRILSEPGLRDQLSRKRYERSKEFSWDKAAHQTMDVYNEVEHL